VRKPAQIYGRTPCEQDMRARSTHLLRQRTAGEMRDNLQWKLRQHRQIGYVDAICIGGDFTRGGNDLEEGRDDVAVGMGLGQWGVKPGCPYPTCQAARFVSAWRCRTDYCVALDTKSMWKMLLGINFISTPPRKI
jgi:hypothetical protein